MATETPAQQSTDQFLDRGHISWWERLGYAAGALLLISLWLPWFSTSSNPNSKIISAGIGPDDSANAWDTFGSILPWMFVLLAVAPLILTWIIARNHKLSHPPGEITMIAGLTGTVLVLCNGVILGRPDPGIEVSLSIGWFLALLACLAISVAGFRRQAMRAATKKPPGVI